MNKTQSLVDDGEGNVIDPTITPSPKVTNVMGQIFYSQGMVVLTDSHWYDFATTVASSGEVGILLELVQCRY